MKKLARKKKGTVNRTTSRPKRTKTPAPAQVSLVPPLPIHRIMVPIDFSVHSKNALRYAIPLAEQFKASLHLIYVIEPMIYPADLGFGQVVMPNVEEELRTKSEQELQSLMEREIGATIRAEAVVKIGKPHQEILNQVVEKNIDLIVLATHGHSGVEQILFGSTAMRVVRLAKCPVMTIRPNTD